MPAAIIQCSYKQLTVLKILLVLLGSFTDCRQLPSMLPCPNKDLMSAHHGGVNLANMEIRGFYPTAITCITRSNKSGRILHLHHNHCYCITT